MIRVYSIKLIRSPASEKLPHICGGNTVDGAGIECYRYQPANNTWAVSGTMAYSHDESAFTYHEQLGLVISGANRGTGTTKVEHTLNGKTIQVPDCKVRDFFIH